MPNNDNLSQANKRGNLKKGTETTKIKNIQIHNLHDYTQRPRSGASLAGPH
jgi:hypothetical protein